MVNFATSKDFLPVLRLLESMGLPRHVKSLTIHVNADDLIEITCTFYPLMDNADAGDERLKLITKKYQIVEKEE